MSRRAIVRLGERKVGTLIEADDATVDFHLEVDYQDLMARPVLGQWFEDRQRVVQHGDRPGGLPAFFANLIPEGDLRLTLEDRLGLRSGDSLGLLCAVGRDLPGALVVELEAGEPPASPLPLDPKVDDSGLRFSLAGVQLKFSMVRGTDRFYLPGRDERGDWIAKIAYDAFPDLAANEWTTMEWARRLGFEVPTIELRPLSDLTDVPHVGAADAQVFLIQRYDRGPERRIHQEDFQQIVGRQPDKKYDDMSYDKLILLATSVVGEDAYPELMRRLAFIAASGNNDAHMKNSSVIYPDGVTARLSPLYDQVFTAQWPQYAVSLALKIDGTKNFAALDVGHFRELARRIARPETATAEIVEQAVAEAAVAWSTLRDHPSVTPAYRDALQRHWQRVPILRRHTLSL